MATSTSTTVFIQIEESEKIEAIEIPPSCTIEEITSVFYAAAEIFEDSGAILKLLDASGSIVPIGHGLEGNSKEEPYKLKIVGGTVKCACLCIRSEGKCANAQAKARGEGKLVSSSSIFAFAQSLPSFSSATAAAKPNNNTAVATLTAQLSAQMKKVPIAPRLDSHYTHKPKYILTEETKGYIRTPSFDNWSWDDFELFGIFEFMFEDMGLLSEFKIDVETLRKFLMAVRNCYNNNPFHNFKHCFCVSQMMFGIINTTEVHKKLKPIDKLILILSTIGHDLDHPGFNNTYQINAATDLAIIYNDISPLENHHAAVLFTLLSNDETNILANVSDAVYRDARKNIIRCILATDMAKHGEIMAAFKKSAENFNFDDAEHKSLLLQIIVKCSDISNEVRPTHVAEPWVEALLNEFFTQSDTEKAQGLPTAPFMDRDKVTKAGAQVGFIGYVMIPLYELAAKVLPNMEDAIIKPIRDSLVYYKEMLEKTPK
ncbi:cGMP phosphodiesterase [Chytriomyces cf. hyalinus JEL632]|nr:cGMP phosphodiesterase [Chytriomyces cf. hyalinus JEL632]